MSPTYFYPKYQSMLSITYFYREPRKTGVSIEGIFKLVKERLKGKVDINEFFCDQNASQLKNTLRAGKFASQINHITGDVNFLAFGLRGKKNILTVHDLGHYETLKKRGFIQHTIYRLFWFKYPLKYINIVTVVSHFTKSKLIEYFNFPEDRIRVIYDPVKPVFKFSRCERLNDIPRILQIGTGAHKNLNSLIEAVKGTNVHLDIIAWIGDDVIKKLNDNHISYTVYNALSDEDLYKRYVACDILYFASFYEGFGMPVIEAQAVGRPVITSNMGAMKEVAGDSAYLVDPNNVAEIKQAILNLTGDMDMYNEFVKKGRENVVKFDCDKIAADYLSVYTELYNS